MKEDPSFERVCKLFEVDVERMVARHQARTNGHDRCEVNEADGTVSYYLGKSLLWKAQMELLGSLVHGGIKLSTGALLRWVWGDPSMGAPKRRAEAAYREALHYKAEPIVKNVSHVGRKDAERIVNVAARMARADGVHARENQREVAYFALFDSGEGDRHSARSLFPSAPGSSIVPTPISSAPIASVAPPSPRNTVMPSSVFGTEPASAVRSIPPPLTNPPQTSATKSPPLERLRPAAAAALTAFHAAYPAFREAALVITLELQASKCRFSVQLVAISSGGNIGVVDATRAVVDAVARMVSDAREQGELQWRMIVVRMVPRGEGVGVHLHVETRV